jgi:hypothetical protein
MINLFQEDDTFRDTDGAYIKETDTRKTKILYNLIESSCDPKKDGHIEIFASHGGTFENCYHRNEIRKSYLLPAKPKAKTNALKNPYHDTNTKAEEKYDLYKKAQRLIVEMHKEDLRKLLETPTMKLDGTFQKPGMEVRHNTEPENSHNQRFGGGMSSGNDIHGSGYSNFPNMPNIQDLNLQNPMPKDQQLEEETPQGPQLQQSGKFEFQVRPKPTVAKQLRQEFFTQRSPFIIPTTKQQRIWGLQ